MTRWNLSLTLFEHISASQSRLSLLFDHPVPLPSYRECALPLKNEYQAYSPQALSMSWQQRSELALAFDHDFARVRN
jgi:hypothetical protein